MDLVSVIIPTYNGSKIIERAINSVITQSYENIEIIVVDDNGKDTEEQINTQNIISSYDDSRIRYIAHKYNRNGSAARNTGVSIARGRYIALLDDDDEFLPDKIRLQVEVISNKDDNYALCYTSYINYFEEGRQRIIYAEKEGDLCLELLKLKISLLSSILLIKRDVWLELGGFDEALKRDQDLEFCTRVLFKYKAVFVPEICMKRYVLKRNIASHVSKGVEYRFIYLEKSKDIINSYNKTEKRDIYFAHYTELAKRYLRRRHYFEALKLIIYSKKPMSSSIKLVRDYFIYKKSFRDNNEELFWHSNQE
ncbi:MAG: glycosyltransferase family 2 protein [Gudongella sp.]|jgi:glycosyltransferase involved in cell wall biosynthesis|nr:glycosyltransferase family 2 protein [Gudongella sp.]